MDAVRATRRAAVGREIQALHQHPSPGAGHFLQRAGRSAHDPEPAAAAVQFPPRAGPQERAGVHHAARQRLPAEAAASQGRLPAVPASAAEARRGASGAGERHADGD